MLSTINMITLSQAMFKYFYTVFITFIKYLINLLIHYLILAILYLLQFNFNKKTLKLRSFNVWFFVKKD